MASERRIEKLNIFFKDELSKILDRDVEFSPGTLATITRVRTSSDAHYATVYVSILGADPRNALEILKKNVYALQQALNRKVNMRPVPRIRFAVDEEEERRESVEKSISDLKRKGEL